MWKSLAILSIFNTLTLKQVCWKTKTFLKSFVKSLKLFLKLFFKKIADEFDKILPNIGTDLANKIPNGSKQFDFYITKINTSMESHPLSINELKDAFFSIKINESPGHDEVSFNVIKKCFGE